MKIKSVFTITIIALLPLAGFAQTPPAPPQPPGPPGMPSHHEKGPKVPVTYLGVETSQVPPVVSEQLGLGKGLGLVVDYVEPNSPAAAGGVQQNDILKMLNDQILIEPSQLRKLLQTFPDGTEVTLTVLRKGQEQKLTAKLAKKEVPQRHHLFPGGNHDWHWDFDETGDLGDQMQDLKEQLKEQLGDAQHGIIRGAVMQAHEAARRAKDDARRAADELRIFFEDNGAMNASRIDLGKAQIECPPTCVSDTRSYSKAICEQLLRDTIMIPEVTPIPRTRMTTMMMMEKTLNHHRSTCRSTHLPARSFQIQSHFDGQRRNSAEHLNLV